MSTLENDVTIDTDDLETLASFELLTYMESCYNSDLIFGVLEKM